MGKLIKNNLKGGYNLIVPEGTGGLEFLSFAILNLNVGESYSLNTEEKELVLILLGGKSDITVEERTYSDLSRKGIFEESATTLLIPRRKCVDINAKDKVQLALAFAPAEKDHKVLFVPPSEVKRNIVGKGQFSRQVVDIIDSNCEAERLVVGETFNEIGKWSGYPPHKHDIDNYPEETNLEEIYFYRVDPPQGFGFQRIYTDDRSLDEAYAVEDGDTVITPKGYHTVAAAPGYRLYYLWILAGRQRIRCFKDDPAHQWTK